MEPEPPNQLRADFVLKLSLELLNMVAYEVEGILLRFGWKLSLWRQLGICAPQDFSF